MTTGSSGPTIPLPTDFEFNEILGFLAPRAVPALEHVTASSYERTLRLDGRVVILTVTLRKSRSGHRSVSASCRPRLSPAHVRSLVRRLLDLDTDLDTFQRRVRAMRDPMLTPLVAARPGLRIPRYIDPFEGVVRAILGQQVSLAAAATMSDRLVRLAGTSTSVASGCGLRGFPSPDTIVRAGSRRLRAIGLTGAKVAALLAVARAIMAGRLDWTGLEKAKPEAAQACLESVRGIGPWTAACVRMRVLGDHDAFLPTDLGVRKAFARCTSNAAPPPTEAIVARAERWRPWRAYATMHLWRSLAP